MKKIVVSTILFFSVISAYSQGESLLEKYTQKIEENIKLENDLKNERQKYSDQSILVERYQTSLRDCEIELRSVKHKVSKLDNSKIKEERDNLQKKVDNLNMRISELEDIISDKDKQILAEKTSTKEAVNKAKNEGKAEVMASIENSYNNLSFDDLISSSTKKSIARDIKLVVNNPELMQILKDLQIYFNIRELLSEKFDDVQIERAQDQLEEINRQSNLLDALNEDAEFYKDFNQALEKTISELVELDEKVVVDGDYNIQKIKFADIVTILTDYLYNYSDYTRYPYLSDIVLEIVKRKQPNADADIKDLLNKL
jgi:hypothetical protein